MAFKYGVLPFSCHKHTIIVNDNFPPLPILFAGFPADTSDLSDVDGRWFCLHLFLLSLSPYHQQSACTRFLMVRTARIWRAKSVWFSAVHLVYVLLCGCISSQTYSFSNEKIIRRLPEYCLTILANITPFFFSFTSSLSLLLSSFPPSPPLLPLFFLPLSFLHLSFLPPHSLHSPSLLTPSLCPSPLPSPLLPFSLPQLHLREAWRVNGCSIEGSHTAPLH